MAKFKLIRIILLTFCVTIYAYSSVRVEQKRSLGIAVDLSKPLSIVWPFETAVVGELGEKGLRIGPEIGRGWRGEAGGKATYKFYVPQKAEYHIWGYCLWFDECANAVFIKIDDLDKAILGNDPVYRKWHWVRGFSVKLEKGTHTLVLSNHSDHIAIQKLLMNTSGNNGPEKSEVVFRTYFMMVLTVAIWVILTAGGYLPAGGGS